MRVEDLYWDLMVTFPTMKQTREGRNIEKLPETVRHDGSVCGVAFDGDGDRVGFIDETGMPIRGHPHSSLGEGDACQRPGTVLRFTFFVGRSRRH